MGRFGKVAVTAALLATAAGTAAPAEAHIGPGGAIIAGLAGLGVGAAIASDHPHRYYGGYGYGYGAPAPVAYGYYAPPPPPVRVVYAPAYGYGYGYGYGAPRCRIAPHWDGWAGRYVPVRRCW